LGSGRQARPSRYEEGILSCPVELKSYIPDIRAAATLAGKPGIAVQYCLKIAQGMVEAPSTDSFLAIRRTMNRVGKAPQKKGRIQLAAICFEQFDNPPVGPPRGT